MRWLWWACGLAAEATPSIVRRLALAPRFAREAILPHPGSSAVFSRAITFCARDLALAPAAGSLNGWSVSEQNACSEQQRACTVPTRSGWLYEPPGGAPGDARTAAGQVRLPPPPPPCRREGNGASLAPCLPPLAVLAQWQPWSIFSVAA